MAYGNYYFLTTKWLQSSLQGKAPSKKFNRIDSFKSLLQNYNSKRKPSGRDSDSELIKFGLRDSGGETSS
jgi:hypothetical protein